MSELAAHTKVPQARPIEMNLFSGDRFCDKCKQEVVCNGFHTMYQTGLEFIGIILLVEVGQWIYAISCK